MLFPNKRHLIFKYIVIIMVYLSINDFFQDQGASVKNMLVLLDIGDDLDNIEGKSTKKLIERRVLTQQNTKKIK